MNFAYFKESGLIVLSNAKVSEQKLEILTSKGYDLVCTARGKFSIFITFSLS